MFLFWKHVLIVLSLDCNELNCWHLSLHYFLGASWWNAVATTNNIPTTPTGSSGWCFSITIWPGRQYRNTPSQIAQLFNSNVKRTTFTWHAGNLLIPSVYCRCCDKKKSFDINRSSGDYRPLKEESRPIFKDKFKTTTDLNMHLVNHNYVSPSTIMDQSASVRSPDDQAPLADRIDVDSDTTSAVVHSSDVADAANERKWVQAKVGLTFPHYLTMFCYA